MFEDKIRGTATEVLTYFNENPSKIKGEIVIVVSGKESSKKNKKFDDSEESE
jgi:16S rRNA C1402 (ribose-2'-O) methylase RsmI